MLVDESTGIIFALLSSLHGAFRRTGQSALRLQQRYILRQIRVKSRAFISSIYTGDKHTLFLVVLFLLQVAHDADYRRRTPYDRADEVQAERDAIPFAAEIEEEVQVPRDSAEAADYNM